MVEQVSSLKTGVKYKETPIGKIPVDWEVVRLGDVCDIIGGSTPPTKRKEYWGGHIPFATPTDITGLRGREISITKESITSEGLSSCGARLLPVGSILLTSRATLGACAINTKSMATNQGFASLVCSEKAYNWFIFYKMISLKRELQTLGSGSTFKEVSKGNIRSLFLAIPSPPEQKKIAEILTTVDDAIEKTTQIIDKTKELKKGLMQRLLTRGIGHKKFKKTEIGEIPVEWEVVKLKDIVQEFYNGGTPDTAKIEYWDGDIPWITGADFENQKVNRIRRHITHEGVENSATNVIPEGNLLVVTMTGVGKVAIAPFDIAISQDITGIVLNQRKAIAEFLCWYLDHKSERLRSIIQGTSISGLLRGDLESFIVPLPPVKEQKKITRILSANDDEIEKESNHREQLNLLKNGLMQVLLTGKLRVIV
ncbi:MAG: restriction endonuclease subunit S [Deltaproteobacteria bacterium]|nr:restriction endonuclease subunit S [Deltaproteobacteria bacterium]